MTPHRNRLAATILAGGICLVLPGGPAAAGHEPGQAQTASREGLVDARSREFGGYKFPFSYGAARRRFGAPSRVGRPIRDRCGGGVRAVSWRSHGVRIFYSDRPYRKIRRLDGSLQPLSADGYTSRWYTAKGLRVGDSTRKMFRLYPKDPGQPISRGRGLFIYQLDGRTGPPDASLYAAYRRGRVRELWLQTGIGCD